MDGVLIDPEIVIIGGGIIGLAIARELHKRGYRRICVLEKGEPGSEASWAAAGILAPQAEADRADAFFDLCCESNRLFPTFARELLDETGVDIELDTIGLLYVALDDEDALHLEERYKWQRAAGMNVERLTGDETLRIEPEISTEVRFALRFPDDRQVENRKLVTALIKYAELNGIRLITSAEVTNILTEGSQVTGVKTIGGQYPCDTAVLATGAWSSFITVDGLEIKVPIKPIRGQMISYSEQAVCRHVLYSRRGYIVPRADGRLLAGATCDDAGFDRGIRDEDTQLLRTAAGEIIPRLRETEIAECWAGLRPLAEDGLPVIGAFAGAEGLYVATGHYRNGILLAPLTARMIADAIEGKQSADLSCFGPDRFSK